MLTPDRKPFHIPTERGKVGRYCILPGAPERVEQIAALLEEPVFVGRNREFTVWNGKLADETVTVCSTGIGGPSAAIAAEELVDCGAEVLIRVGTCGGIATAVASGDLVVATGAVRQDGTSHEYAPPEYPAVPDFGVTAALRKAALCVAAEAGNRNAVHLGVVQSKDSFYGQHSPARMPVSGDLEAKWEAWKRLGVLASEMEASTLFTVGAARGVRTGAVFHVIWNQERAKAGMDTDAEESHDTKAAVRTAVEAIRLLISVD